MTSGRSLCVRWSSWFLMKLRCGCFVVVARVCSTGSPCFEAGSCALCTGLREAPLEGRQLTGLQRGWIGRNTLGDVVRGQKTEGSSVLATYVGLACCCGLSIHMQSNSNVIAWAGNQFREKREKQQDRRKWRLGPRSLVKARIKVSNNST